MKWGSLINSTGSYISKYYEITNVSSKYLTTILANIINIHHQQVEFFLFPLLRLHELDQVENNKFQ